jgi:hypothetical protein
MNPVVLGAVGAVGGLVVGIIIGMVVGKGGAKKIAADCEAQVKDARQKLEAAKKEAAAHLEKEQARAKDAEKAAAEAKEKRAAVEKALEQQKGQVKQLQNGLAEAEAVRAKLSSQVESQNSARAQAEARVKQAEAAANQAQQQLGALQSQLQAAQAQLTEAKETAERRNREVQKLRGELSAHKKGGAGLEDSVEAFAGTDGSLDAILKLLMEQESQRAAVLADANGIIVAAVGEAGLKEGMAATTQLVGSMCTQLVDMVPFSSIRSYVLQDAQTNVLAGRAFICQGETVGLITYGPRLPSDRVLDGAMASLSAALE